MKIKQVSRPIYNLLKFQLLQTRTMPQVITLSQNHYKKLCKELQHKVKVVFGIKLVNYYL